MEKSDWWLQTELWVGLQKVGALLFGKVLWMAQNVGLTGLIHANRSTYHIAVTLQPYWQ